MLNWPSGISTTSWRTVAPSFLARIVDSKTLVTFTWQPVRAEAGLLGHLQQAGGDALAEINLGVRADGVRVIRHLPLEERAVEHLGGGGILRV